MTSIPNDTNFGSRFQGVTIAPIAEQYVGTSNFLITVTPPGSPPQVPASRHAGAIPEYPLFAVIRRGTRFSHARDDQGIAGELILQCAAVTNRQTWRALLNVHIECLQANAIEATERFHFT